MNKKEWNIPFLGSPKLEPQVIENVPIQLYKEIKPFTVDPDTGEILNPTSEPRLMKAGTRDMDEEIQSYSDCSLYKILEKLNLYNNTITGLEPELNVRTGAYDVDISEMPDNINDVSQYLKNEKNIASADMRKAPDGSKSEDGKANSDEVKNNDEAKHESEVK